MIMLTSSHNHSKHIWGTAHTHNQPLAIEPSIRIIILIARGSTGIQSCDMLLRTFHCPRVGFVLSSCTQHIQHAIVPPFECTCCTISCRKRALAAHRHSTAGFGTSGGAQYSRMSVCKLPLGSCLWIKLRSATCTADGSPHSVWAANDSTNNTADAPVE